MPERCGRMPENLTNVETSSGAPLPSSCEMLRMRLHPHVLDRLREPSQIAEVSQLEGGPHDFGYPPLARVAEPPERPAPEPPRYRLPAVRDAEFLAGHAPGRVPRYRVDLTCIVFSDTDCRSLRVRFSNREKQGKQYGKRKYLYRRIQA